MPDSISAFDDRDKALFRNLAETIACMLSLDIQPAFGKGSYGLRGVAELTVASRRTGVSRSSLYQYMDAIFAEDGTLTYGPKQISILMKLAKPYGISLSQLFFVAESASSPHAKTEMLLAFRSGSMKIDYLKGIDPSQSAEGLDYVPTKLAS